MIFVRRIRKTVTMLYRQCREETYLGLALICVLCAGTAMATLFTLMAIDAATPDAFLGLGLLMGLFGLAAISCIFADYWDTSRRCRIKRLKRAAAAARNRPRAGLLDLRDEDIWP